MTKSETSIAAGETRFREMVKEYCLQYPELRSDHESLSNLDFHMDHGLRVKVPEDWHPISVVGDIVLHAKSCYIVYGSAKEYEEIQATLDDSVLNSGDVDFVAWHEIYVALYSKRNQSSLQHINTMLKSKTAVVVTSAFDVDLDVLAHIQMLCNGCLVCLD